MFFCFLIEEGGETTPKRPRFCVLLFFNPWLPVFLFFSLKWTKFLNDQNREDFCDEIAFNLRLYISCMFSKTQNYIDENIAV